MKVLVTGATGFTGSHLIPHLLKKRLDVTCFVRTESDLSVLPKDKVRIAIGDLNSPKTLEQALHGIDILINIASLGFGHAEGIVAAAENAGIKRVLFISTTAIFTNLNAPSKVMRLAAEKRITESTLDYTVLRPTMIYGSSQDRNICRLIKYLQKYPVLPVVGSGEHLQQPIFVKDVAQAIIQAMYSEKSCRKSYNISGAEPLSFNNLVTVICSQLSRSVRILHVPVTPIVRILSFIEHIVTLPIYLKHYAIQEQE
ncbi:MAG: NAD-dependent epimerase/dehydratase family protein [Candidatus Electrothrix sp. AR1]|nr:NAD-dependent epimerase/dehydratase family protein [Candidatus Electrothrix sp. AR1]